MPGAGLSLTWEASGKRATAREALADYLAATIDGVVRRATSEVARDGERVVLSSLRELHADLEEESGRALAVRGGEAVRLMTGHLFTQEGASRVEVSTDVENRPMRAVSERLGFALEGVLRSFMPTREGRRDYALYAMTREDWEKEKVNWTRAS